MDYYWIVALAFIAFFIYEVYTNQTNRLMNTRQNDIAFVVILLVGIVTRLIIASLTPGYETDMNCFKAWSIRAFEGGFSNFYDVTGEYFADYPPGYIYILYLLGAIRQVFHIGVESSAFILLLKMPAILCDILTACILYRFAKKQGNLTAALFLSSLFILNPAIIINSSNFGQIDSVFTLFILLTFLLFYRKKTVLSMLCYAAALLIKPQALLFAPIVLTMVLFVEKQRVKTLLISLATGIVAMFIGILPFTQNFNFFWILSDKYFGTMNGYNFYSINASNLYGFLGKNWVEIKEPLAALWNFAILVIIISVCTYLFLKSKNRAKLFFIPFLGLFSMFLFLTKMHERYLYPAIALLLASYILLKNKHILYLCAGISVVHYLNVARSLYGAPPNDLINILISLAFFALFAYACQIAYRIFYPISDVAEGESQKRILTVKDTKIVRADIIIMAIITLLYSIVAFWAIGDCTAPETYYQPSMERDSFVVDLGSVQQVQVLKYFTGIGLGSYIVGTSDDNIT